MATPAWHTKNIKEISNSKQAHTQLYHKVIGLRFYKNDEGFPIESHIALIQMS
jgi:hypothetical protein